MSVYECVFLLTFSKYEKFCHFDSSMYCQHTTRRYSRYWNNSFTNCATRDIRASNRCHGHSPHLCIRTILNAATNEQGSKENKIVILWRWASMVSRGTVCTWIIPIFSWQLFKLKFAVKSAIIFWIIKQLFE